MQRMNVDCLFAQMGRLSDEELISAWQRSTVDKSSDAYLEEVYRRYHSRMTSWCFRLSRDSDQAMDLAQEVFVKAFEHLHAYRGESKISTWLYAIARNHCLAFARKQRLATTDSADSISRTLEDANAMKAFNSIEDGELLHRVRRAMSTTLRPIEAEIINLYYLQELSLEAITQLLKLPNPSGAKAYIVRARRKLTWTLRKRKINSAQKHGWSKSRSF